MPKKPKGLGHGLAEILEARRRPPANDKKQETKEILKQFDGGDAFVRPEITIQPVVYHQGEKPESVVNMSTTHQSSHIPPIEGVVYHTSKPQKDRHKRTDETVFSARIKQELASKIRDIAYQNNWTIQEVLEHLVNCFYQNVVNHNFEPVVNKISQHDDMMIFETHEDIIMGYERVVNHKWTRRDDRTGKKYNQIDIKLIEIALITTIEKKLRGNTAKQPIKSFNYFTQEIDLLIEQQRCGELPAALDEYHKYVLSTWEKRIKKIRDEKWANKKTG